MTDFTARLRLVVDSSGLDKSGRKLKGVERNARGAQRNVDRLAASFKSLGVVVGSAVVVGGVLRLSKAWLDAAVAVENYGTRLNAILKDQERSNQFFDDLSKFAATVPFELDQIANSATNLVAVTSGNVEITKDLLPVIADIAAATGMSFQQASEQIQRTYSAGIAAADVFRERGVTAALQIPEAIKKSGEETIAYLIDQFEKGEAIYSGAAEKLAETYQGALSMVQDASFQIANAAGGPIRDTMTALFGEMTEYFNENRESILGTAEAIGGAFADGIRIAAEAAKLLGVALRVAAEAALALGVVKLASVVGGWVVAMGSLEVALFTAGAALSRFKTILMGVMGTLTSAAGLFTVLTVGTLEFTRVLRNVREEQEALLKSQGYEELAKQAEELQRIVDLYDEGGFRAAGKTSAEVDSIRREIKKLKDLMVELRDEDYADIRSNFQKNFIQPAQEAADALEELSEAQKAFNKDMNAITADIEDLERLAAAARISKEEYELVKQTLEIEKEIAALKVHGVNFDENELRERLEYREGLKKVIAESTAEGLDEAAREFERDLDQVIDNFADMLLEDPAQAFENLAKDFGSLLIEEALNPLKEGMRAIVKDLFDGGGFSFGGLFGGGSDGGGLSGLFGAVGSVFSKSKTLPGTGIEVPGSIIIDESGAIGQPSGSGLPNIPGGLTSKIPGSIGGVPLSTIAQSIGYAYAGYELGKMAAGLFTDKVSTKGARNGGIIGGILGGPVGSFLGSLAGGIFGNKDWAFGRANIDLTAGGFSVGNVVGLDGTPTGEFRDAAQDIVNGLNDFVTSLGGSFATGQGGVGQANSAGGTNIVGTFGYTEPGRPGALSGYFGGLTPDGRNGANLGGGATINNIQDAGEAAALSAIDALREGINRGMVVGLPKAVEFIIVNTKKTLEGVQDDIEAVLNFEQLTDGILGRNQKSELQTLLDEITTARDAAISAFRRARDAEGEWRELIQDTRDKAREAVAEIRRGFVDGLEEALAGVTIAGEFRALMQIQEARREDAKALGLAQKDLRTLRQLELKEIRDFTSEAMQAVDGMRALRDAIVELKESGEIAAREMQLIERQMTRSFNQQIRADIDAYTRGPLQDLEDLLEAQAERAALAEELGANMRAVERLTALELQEFFRGLSDSALEEVRDFLGLFEEASDSVLRNLDLSRQDLRSQADAFESFAQQFADLNASLSQEFVAMSPRESLDQYRDRINTLVSDIALGNESAAQSLPQVINAFVQAGRQAFGNTSGFGEILDFAQNALSEAEASSLAVMSDAERQIAVLDDQLDILSDIRDILESQSATAAYFQSYLGGGVASSDDLLDLIQTGAGLTPSVSNPNASASVASMLGQALAPVVIPLGASVDAITTTLSPMPNLQQLTIEAIDRSTNRITAALQDLDNRMDRIEVLNKAQLKELQDAA